ncbi:MAG: hypothetical protein Q8O35_04425 [Humidesulfovibrio sp.]|uniref:hypothetical protein n=1 Tax=Humidesulfovibrio sp. TaxID=2910988 RepID=UPI00273486DD|nr:hypothetical protein [Humidesulfovibrio sp.]MDP2847420.1 hypothetical protein [Humidesulfovibrio sp.]
MNMRTALILALLTALAAGCAAERPPLADTWGLSVRMAVENQKLDPAPASLEPVTGLDGAYVQGAMDAYRKSSTPDARQDTAKAIDTIVVTKGGK